MRRLVLAVVLAMLSFATAAQQYPSRPIHLVATFAAGGAMDLTARSMAAVMSESFGQVIVENRTGGGRLVGTDYVARRPGRVHARHVRRRQRHRALRLQAEPRSDQGLRADYERDHRHAPHRGPSFGEGATQGADRAREARARPASPSARPAPPPQHLAGELFKQQAGGPRHPACSLPRRRPADRRPRRRADPARPYRPPADAAAHQAGKLKVFAVTARKRSPSLPDVPTVEEAGLPGYETVQWFGPAAPAGTPARSSSACTPSSARRCHPTVVERLTKAGLEVAPSESPDAYARFIRAEYDALARHRESRGVTPE